MTAGTVALPEPAAPAQRAPWASRLVEFLLVAFIFHPWFGVLTLVLVFLGYSGLGISLWPNIVPPAISIWEASSPPQSQGFALVGALLIIPLILVYTAWSYYVFRGKVESSDSYH